MKMGKKEKSNGKNQEKPGSFSKVTLIIKMSLKSLYNIRYCKFFNKKAITFTLL